MYLHVDIVLIVLALLVIFFVSFPVYIVGIHKIKRNWTKTFIVKRHRVLLVHKIAAACGMHCICIPLICTSIILRHFKGYENVANIIYVYISIPLMQTFAFIFIFVMGIRNWLLYFDTNFSKYQLEKEWLSAINPTAVNTNWFKNKHKTLGNATYLSRIAVLVAVILYLLDFSLRFSALYKGYNILWIIANWIFWFFALISVGFSFWCWKKLKGIYYDELGIRRELALIGWYGLVYIILVFICTSLYYLDIMSGGLSNGIFYLGLSLIFTGLIAVITIMPVKWNTSSKYGLPIANTSTIRLPSVSMPKQMTKFSTKLSKENVVTSTTCTSGTNTPKQRPFGNNWQDIVCSVYGFEQFMKHLQLEFSIENLLYISEVCTVRLSVLYKQHDWS